MKIINKSVSMKFVGKEEDIHFSVVVEGIFKLLAELDFPNITFEYGVEDYGRGKDMILTLTRTFNDRNHAPVSVEDGDTEKV